MKDRLEQVIGDTKIYNARRDEFKTTDKVPFRVSPTPLILTPDQKKEVNNIGADIIAYFKIIDELYTTNNEVREILDTGKPDLFLIQGPAKYLFVRPDIIVTNEGFRICEIETSPFGLALAEILNKAYSQEGFETMVAEDALSKSIQASTPTDGRIIFSAKTEPFKGQLTFLAEQVFSGENRNWVAEKTDDVDLQSLDNLYRGFYLGEHATDDAVNSLLEKCIEDKKRMLPSLTPHMEEKAILAFIWDKRFEKYLKSRLGITVFNHLREVIPPNWIVGQEKHFALGLPNNMSSSVGLASLSNSKRAFVLKPSGFGSSSSWGEGVSFLHQKSHTGAFQLLSSAIADQTSLHVIQEFKKGMKIPISYTDKKGQIQHMSAKIRLTPYFSATPGEEGKLIAIKATGRENTDLIHGSSDSVNTAVS